MLACFETPYIYTYDPAGPETSPEPTNHLSLNCTVSPRPFASDAHAHRIIFNTSQNGLTSVATVSRDDDVAYFWGSTDRPLRWYLAIVHSARGPTLLYPLFPLSMARAYQASLPPPNLPQNFLGPWCLREPPSRTSLTDFARMVFLIESMTLILSSAMRLEACADRVSLDVSSPHEMREPRRLRLPHVYCCCRAHAEISGRPSQLEGSFMDHVNITCYCASDSARQTAPS